MKYILIPVILFLAACTPQPQETTNNFEDNTLTNPITDQVEETDSTAEEAVLGTEQDLNQTNQQVTNDQMTNNATAEKVILKTSKGDITLKLYPKYAPQTVSNFVTKANDGYYEGLTFHRVEDWVVQGGDPDGNGTGGGKMPTELSDMPFKLGSLGVARGGDIKVSNDSQFFICTDDCAWLTNQYTNFGEVVDGLDVAQSMAIGDTINSIEVVE